MINKITLLYIPFILLIFSCTNQKAEQLQNQVSNFSFTKTNQKQNKAALSFKGSIDTKNLSPEKLIEFAKTLIGIPYKYGSTDVNRGFDCSGFITYVFNHFDIAVPRSSVDFTYVSNEVKLSNSKPGDLILFTGTDSTKRIVGHMGIITQTVDSVKFIHATSGKAYSVTETLLNKYYQGRFMKIIRIFK